MMYYNRWETFDKTFYFKPNHCFYNKVQFIRQFSRLLHGVIHRDIFGYPILYTKNEKEVLLMFQCLIVQTDLPGERQSGMACGNPPFVPSQGMAAVSSLCIWSFWAALPWMRQQQVRATCNCCIHGCFLLEAPHPQTYASRRVGQLKLVLRGQKFIRDYPILKSGNLKSLDITGFVHI